MTTAEALIKSANLLFFGLLRIAQAILLINSSIEYRAEMAAILSRDINERGV